MLLKPTEVYLRRVGKLLSADERAAMEAAIAAAPAAAPVIPGTGGIRKVRWRRGSSGKSGGVRTIYYYRAAQSVVYLLTIYAKSEREDLTAEERRVWKRFVQEIERSSRG